MTPGPTPSPSDNAAEAEKGPRKRSRSYGTGQKTYSRIPEDKYDGASYTSPYWDSYGRKNFNYQGGLSSYNGGSLDKGPLYSDYGGYEYPSERGSGCGGGSEPGWRRALSEPGLPVILLVAGAFAVYLLNNAIPTMFRRKKKRSSNSGGGLEGLVIGLEEFEEKIDRIAEGEDDGENSWISKIYNQFSFFNDGDNSLEENDMDGLEPPLLDETWGLGVRTRVKDIVANATIEEAVPLEEEAGTARGKREAGEDVDDAGGEDEVEEKCRVAMWRCLSHVVEGGLQYMDQPDGLLGFAKKSMFKIAFHGGLTNVWGGVMAIPEARQIKLCMTEHTECMSYEVLRREAHETLDSNDPMLDMMYRKKKEEEKVKRDEKVEKAKAKKRQRLIVNPDFVENLDTDDGSVQYNEDITQNLV